MTTVDEIVTDDIPTVDAASVLRDAAIAGTEPHPVDRDDLLVITTPPGSITTVLDARERSERLSDRPLRAKGTARLTSSPSFCQYVGMHQGPGTAIYADIDTTTVVAVFNGDLEHADAMTAAAAATSPDHVQVPGWGDHRAALKLEPTLEWKHWTGHDRKMLSQADFAEVIEQGLAEIVSPPAADMLELAQTIQGTTGATWRSSQRLNSGQRAISYDETINASAGNHGQIEIPDEFTLALKPFDDSDAYRVQARLRFRINSGALHMGFVLVRPDTVMRDAWKDIVSGIEEATDFTPYLGTPAPARG